LEALDHGL